MSTNDEDATGVVNDEKSKEYTSENLKSGRSCCNTVLISLFHIKHTHTWNQR